MRQIWNNGTEEQRRDLLKSIYGDCYVMFASACSEDWDHIPYGVQRRLERLGDVYKARKK